MALSNKALFSGDNTTKDLTDTAVTVLSGTGDDILTISITPSATRLRDGRDLTYTIVVQNTSTIYDATKVDFTDTYDSANYTVSSVTSSDSAITFDSTTTAGTITASKFAITKGSSLTITVTGKVKA